MVSSSEFRLDTSCMMEYVYIFFQMLKIVDFNWSMNSSSTICLSFSLISPIHTLHLAAVHGCFTIPGGFLMMIFLCGRNDWVRRFHKENKLLVSTPKKATLYNPPWTSSICQLYDVNCRTNMGFWAYAAKANEASTSLIRCLSDFAVKIEDTAIIIITNGVIHWHDSSVY